MKAAAGRPALRGWCQRGNRAPAGAGEDGALLPGGSKQLLSLGAGLPLIPNADADMILLSAGPERPSAAGNGG